MPIIYDMQGYPHFVVDFAERRSRKPPSPQQLADLLIRSIFEDGGLGRIVSVDSIEPGNPPIQWTIRFTGETNGRTADPYIATYDGRAISYNDDPDRQSRDLSEDQVLEFQSKKDGRSCTKGKPCGGSCIAKGKNCRIASLSQAQKKAADSLGSQIVLARKDGLEGRQKPDQGAGKNVTGSDADSKFASANPSDDDANQWLDAKIREYVTDKSGLSGQALADLKYEYSLTDNAGVKDRESFAKAIIDRQNAQGRLTAEQLGWDSGMDRSLASAQERARTGKTESIRKKAEKAAKELADMKQGIEEGVAARNARLDMPMDERLAVVYKIFDNKVKLLSDEQDALRTGVERGNKRAVAKATERVRERMVTTLEDDPDARDLLPRPGANGRVEQGSITDQVKAYLRFTYQKSGGDASALGLGQGRPSLADLRRAYRQKAVETHPDRGGSREAFESVRKSYERLMKAYYPDQVDFLEQDLDFLSSSINFTSIQGKNVMRQIIYDMQGYPHFVVDFAERKSRDGREAIQEASLLVRSFFEEGAQRLVSIDDMDVGVPADGWTIRFTGVTGAQDPQAYIATYDGDGISYNEDAGREPASMGEWADLVIDFKSGSGSKACTKGKLCGGSCIAKGKNCRIDGSKLKPSQKKAADRLSKLGRTEIWKAQELLANLKKSQEARKESKFGTGGGKSLTRRVNAKQKAYESRLADIKASQSRRTKAAGNAVAQATKDAERLSKSVPKGFR
jgi:curved DNA-binding protein CbpA